MGAAARAATVFLALSAPAGAQDGMELQRCVWSCLSAFGPNTNPAYHQCVADRCTEPQAAQAAPKQGGWSFMDALVAGSLDVQAGEASPQLFVDHGDPAIATVGLGFHYFDNRTGGNATHLNVGLFLRTGAGWVFAGPVEGIFGMTPTDAAFPPGRVEITTVTPGPNDPRCCPSQHTRWSVDVTTRAVSRLAVD